MIVAGVDLSLTGLALVAVPSNWDFNFRRVYRVTLSTDSKSGPIVQRMRDLACDAATWIEWVGAKRVYLECPIITRKQHNLDQVFRIGGMLEMRLLDLCNVQSEWAPLIKARRLFCGSVSKAVAQEAVLAVTDWFEDEHQRDAFVTANWGLHECQWTCFSAARAA